MAFQATKHRIYFKKCIIQCVKLSCIRKVQLFCPTVRDKSFNYRLKVMKGPIHVVDGVIILKEFYILE